MIDLDFIGAAIICYTAYILSGMYFEHELALKRLECAPIAAVVSKIAS
jgi:hypothetical protein